MVQTATTAKRHTKMDDKKLRLVHHHVFSLLKDRNADCIEREAISKPGKFWSGNVVKTTAVA